VQRLVTFGLALYSFFLIKTSIPRLPARIPTHFNAAGEADGWGSPDTLWFLLLVQVLTCGVFLVAPLLARRFPGTVNLGSYKLSDFTPAQRERIMPLLTDMMGYMSVLLGLLFSILLRESIHAALSSHPHFAPWREFGLFLAGTAVTIIYYLRRIFAIANETRRENPGTT
jgi:uncharacterized membrane protein